MAKQSWMVPKVHSKNHCIFTLLLVTATIEQIFEQQLIFCNTLYGLNQVRCDGVFQAELPLETFKVLTTMLDQKLGGMGFIRAIFDVAIEFGRPSYKGMADVLRHTLVLF